MHDAAQALIEATDDENEARECDHTLTQLNTRWRQVRGETLGEKQHNPPPIGATATVNGAYRQ